jgi:hypothetical protein
MASIASSSFLAHCGLEPAPDRVEPLGEIPARPPRVLVELAGEGCLRPCQGTAAGGTRDEPAQHPSEGFAEGTDVDEEVEEALPLFAHGGHRAVRQWHGEQVGGGLAHGIHPLLGLGPEGLGQLLPGLLRTLGSRLAERFERRVCTACSISPRSFSISRGRAAVPASSARRST